MLTEWEKEEQKMADAEEATSKSQNNVVPSSFSRFTPAIATTRAPQSFSPAPPLITSTDKVVEDISENGTKIMVTQVPSSNEATLAPGNYSSSDLPQIIQPGLSSTTAQPVLQEQPSVMTCVLPEIPENTDATVSNCMFVAK